MNGIVLILCTADMKA